MPRIYKNICQCVKLKKSKKSSKTTKTTKTTKKKNLNKNKININVSSAGSSVVPYQQQYKLQNQELYNFFPTNHTLNIKHSFAPSDRPFNLNSIVQNEPEENLLNLLKLNESNQAFNFDEVYSEKADDPSISAFFEPLKASSEKIEILNKPYQPQGLEKVIYPEEQLYNKQKIYWIYINLKKYKLKMLKKLEEVDHPKD